MTYRTRLRALIIVVGWCGAVSAQPLNDPGPAWAGITDTTTLRLRIERHVAESEALLDRVRGVAGPRTAEDTVVPLTRAEFKLYEAQWLAGIGLNAHPDPAFRAVAQAWETRLAERIAALGTDRTLYEALAALDPDALSPEMRYVVQRELAAYRRDGVDLDEGTRARVAALRTRITEVGTRFERNIFTDVKTVRVHPDSLAGVPADWVAANASGAPDGDGLVTVTITPANFEPLATSAESADLRARATRAYFTRGYPRNVPVIDSLRALRHELAGLLGFDSWAAYSLEPMMAGSPERVARFLDEVDEASAEAARREADALLAVRQREEPGATSVPFFEQRYWANELRRRAYGFDQRALRAYFPYAAVRDGTLSAYAQMFGLAFRPAPGTPVWSEAAEPYEVWEAGALVGRFTLDMHPRGGKYGHFGAFALRVGGGDLPELVLLCNFPGGREGDPGLLSPDQVSVFFHEFGHLVHFLVAGRETVIGEFESDFVEAPSQLFEAWARDYDVLRRFGRHHETGEPVPADLVAAYRRADAFGRARAARVNLWLSDLSLDLYAAPPEADPTEDVERRAAEHLPGALPEWFHPSTGIPHLNAYGPSYYTYVWSEVIARDLLTGFDPDDLLGAEAGRRYRDLVLAPTGTAPSAVLVERFLGRPFNADAWRDWLNEGEAEE